MSSLRAAGYSPVERSEASERSSGLRAVWPAWPAAEAGHFARLEELRRRLSLLQSAAALADAVSAVSAPLGLPTVMCGAPRVRGEIVHGHFFFDNWPAELKRAFLESSLAGDPVIHEVRRRMTPFTWRDLRAEGSFEERWPDVLDRFRLHGLHDGLAIPIHGPGNYVGLMLFAGPLPLDLTAMAHVILLALAHLAHERGREIDRAGAAVEVPRLTTRERQVMRWIANGKTDAEIAKELSLSAATVHSYAEQAKRKLGARSRPQAVHEMARFDLL